MARTVETADDQAKRALAKEMFRQGSTQSEIVQALGIQQPRAAYWQRVDKWTRIEELPANADGNAIKKYLRNNLAVHLRTLSTIIEGTAQDRIRVLAITEYAKIAKLVGALDLSQNDDSPAKTATLPEFSDELDGNGQTQSS